MKRYGMHLKGDKEILEALNTDAEELDNLEKNTLRWNELKNGFSRLI